MKSLVTGGAGFIGSHLVDKLLELGHEVIVLDNFSTGRRENLNHIEKQIKIIECDLSVSGTWAQHFVDADFVFHLAALADIIPSIQKPEAYFRANVNGAFNVLQASKAANVKRFIYSASSSCYGIPDNYPTSETAEIRPQYPYALTKRLGEELVMHWAQVYKLPALSLRFFNVYGTRSRTSGTYGAVFGVFLAQKLANHPLTVVGDGAQTRDFTYVTDIAAALIAAAQSNKVGEVYNVGSGQTVSVNRLVELLGCDKIHIPKRPGEPDSTFADISKIKKYLQWQPRISIEQGVSEVVKNIDYWKSAPVWTPDKIQTATKYWFQYLGGDMQEIIKKVYITGGAGYVGAMLVPRLLEEGFEVTVLDLMMYGEEVLKKHPRLNIIKGDIRDRELLKNTIPGHDAVIHLACISNDPSFELNPDLGKSINLDAFQPLVEISKAAGVKRFVYASSSSVYGVKEECDVHEDMTLEPLTDYSKFKADCEKILKNYQSPEFTTVTIRPATVCGYSPRQRLDVVVNILTNLAFHKRKISVFGGKQLRPNIHIADMVEAYVTLLRAPKEKIAGEIFNAGFENQTVLDLAETVQKVVGDDVQLIATPTNDNRSYHISSRKITEKLGFTPRHTIEEAVKDLKHAFEAGKLPNSFEDERYFNIKRMQSLQLR